MFIVNFADGTTAREKIDVNDIEGVYWDDLPNKPITALHLTLTKGFQGRMGTGKTVAVPPSVVTISNYTHYYFANEASATIFSLNGPVATAANPEPTLIRQVIAGIDQRNDFVLYIEVDRKGNVNTKRFPISQLTIRPEALKQGMIK